jgi:hypothetical protein
MSARDLAARLGMRPGRKRADCPACGYRAALAILPARQGRPPRLWCANGCRSAELARAAGLASTYARTSELADEAVTRARKQERAWALWRGSDPAPGTAADRYLAGRGLTDLARSATLRFRYDCPHPLGGRLPALIATVTAGGTRDCFLAIHRTFLTRDGRKADIDPVRATLGPYWGGVVRLDPLAPELVIGEGIESSASAGRLLGLPAWAALTAGTLAALVLPEPVRAVVIAADRDSTGACAAERAAARWRAEGRAVRIAAPDRIGADFNDVLREKSA